MKLYCISIKSIRSVSFFLLLICFLFVLLEFLNVNSQELLVAATNQDRVSAINSYGFDVLPEAVEVKDIVIPRAFSDVYEKYNQIQIEAGFNLKNYCGSNATIYKYKLKNSSDTEYVNLIVCDDIIVGGDITDARLNGEMKPFKPAK